MAILVAGCDGIKEVPVTSVSVNPPGIILTEGEYTQLQAAIQPDDATDKAVSWSSSNASAATVDASGKVTAVKAGSANIIATAGGKSGSCSVTVNPKIIPVASVSLSKTRMSMTEGDSETLTATVKPVDATDKTISWSSSNTSIATVDASGKVGAVKAGSANIIAKAGDITATCIVSVAPAAIPGGHEGTDRETWE